MQVVSALAAAHARGLIQPENLIVRPDGYVKLFDFALAKPPRAVRSPTLASPGVDPRMDDIRNDLRFKEIVRGIGIPFVARR